MEFYWTIVAAVFGGLWAILSMVRDQRRQVVEDTRAVMARLLEFERLGIEHPEIRMYLSVTALEREDYFRDPQRLTENEFFKAKSFMYAQLDMFDEILAILAHNRSLLVTFRTKAILEDADWKAYMKQWMAHPLSRSILNNEGHIFGNELQSFWKINEANISASIPDRFSW